MPDNTRLITGLPAAPASELPAQLFSELSTVYRAIHTLTSLVGTMTGIDPPDDLEIAAMDPTSYLLGAQASRWYPTVAIVGGVTRGQVVHISAANTVTLAVATSAAGVAIGIANETRANGQKVEVLVGPGLTDSIGGMTAGTLYYLSTTPGAIQNLRPVIPGQIVQPIGFALTTTQMLMSISSYFQQL